MIKMYLNSIEILENGALYSALTFASEILNCFRVNPICYGCKCFLDGIREIQKILIFCK